MFGEIIMVLMIPAFVSGLLGGIIGGIVTIAIKNKEKEEQ